MRETRTSGLRGSIENAKRKFMKSFVYMANVADPTAHTDANSLRPNQRTPSNTLEHPLQAHPSLPIYRRYRHYCRSLCSITAHLPDTARPFSMAEVCPEGRRQRALHSYVTSSFLPIQLCLCLLLSWTTPPLSFFLSPSSSQVLKPCSIYSTLSGSLSRSASVALTA